MPVQSIDERVGDDAVERVGVVDAGALPLPSRSTLPPPNLHSSPYDGEVALDLGDERRVAEAHAIARRRAEHVRVVARDRCARLMTAPSAWPRRSSPSRRGAPSCSRQARSAPPCRRGCRGACRRARARSNIERAVRLGEGIVAADLDGPIADVLDRRCSTRPAPSLSSISPGAHERLRPARRAAGAPDPAKQRVRRDRQEAAVERERRGRRRRARSGWCTVTSFVPSGNVPSTWTSSIISATPSMTWARPRIGARRPSARRPSGRRG